MAKIQAKRGTVQVSKLSQGIGYTGLFSMKAQNEAPHKLRVTAEYDSHNCQSWAKVERWSGTEWREVYTLRGAGLKGWKERIAYTPGAVAEGTFSADVAFLLERAEEVLN